MRLLRLLLRYSPGLLAAAILLGAAGGAMTAGLIAEVNSLLAAGGAARAYAFFALLCLAVPLTRFLSAWLLLHLGQRAILDLRMELSRRILTTPLAALERLGAHRLLAVLTDDLTTIGQAVVVIPVFCVNAALVLGCLAYMGWLAWRLLAGILLAIAVGLVAYQLALAGSLRLLRRARLGQDLLFKHLRSLTDGIKELKLHGARREAFLGRLREDGDAVRRLNLLARSVLAAASSMGQLLLFLIVGLALLLGRRLGTGDARTLTGFVLCLIYMIGPLEVLMDALDPIGRSRVAFAKIDELGVTFDSGDADLARPAAAPRRDPRWRRLEMRQVTYSHRREGEEKPFRLGPIDLVLEPGEVLFVIGGNGSGKTTFGRLLTGLYAPESGEIRLDGRTCDGDSRDAYRQHFAAVFSDFFLFDSLLGLDVADLDRRARQYLERLQLADKVQVEDGELSTTLLSQGQRRRLALLTAYLEDRPIYLFDEWAADQDPEFREIFYRQILPELKARAKAVVVISHDDRYYDVADRILKLEYGHVIYAGSHPAADRPAAELSANEISRSA